LALEAGIGLFGAKGRRANCWRGLIEAGGSR